MSGTELSASIRAAYMHLLEQQFGLRPGRQATDANHVDEVVMQLLATSVYGPGRPVRGARGRVAAADAGGARDQHDGRGNTLLSRHPQIEALRRVVLPDLIARHQTDRRLRALVGRVLDR